MYDNTRDKHTVVSWGHYDVPSRSTGTPQWRFLGSLGGSHRRVDVPRRPRAVCGPISRAVGTVSTAGTRRADMQRGSRRFSITTGHKLMVAADLYQHPLHAAAVPCQQR